MCISHTKDLLLLPHSVSPRRQNRPPKDSHHCHRKAQQLYTATKRLWKMATLATDIDAVAPDADLVEATLVEGVVYTSIHACEFYMFALNSEGAVDCGKNGEIYSRFEPALKTKYVQVSAGVLVGYILRDDGVVVRTKAWRVGARPTEDCKILPPPNIKYTHVASGPHASYFVRDDGKVDRTLGSGKIQLTMTPPEKTMYTQVVAGHLWSYFLRSDGVVDFSNGEGKINGSLICKDAGVSYTQITFTPSDTHENQALQVYLIRSDGSADKVAMSSRLSHPAVVGNVKCATTTKKDVKYVAGSTCRVVTYLLRSDGAVDRIVKGVSVSETLRPPSGQRYTSVCAGNQASYFLRSDGKIERTTGKGVVSSTVEAPQDL